VLGGGRTANEYGLLAGATQSGLHDGVRLHSATQYANNFPMVTIRAPVFSGSGSRRRRPRAATSAEYFADGCGGQRLREVEAGCGFAYLAMRGRAFVGVVRWRLVRGEDISTTTSPLRYLRSDGSRSSHVHDLLPADGNGIPRDHSAAAYVASEYRLMPSRKYNVGTQFFPGTQSLRFLSRTSRRSRT